ncbi:Na(+)/H(+) antiporter ApNhaP [BD1-7 clade bacterium]|uniref:Na(+)/H(+) antiporter ApNhaP n=1 Tax=BD1-7 clade bacterium TaxID=2029982 RepID=A0A5S9QL76_9GAMM|nr:Na(+)/H(+) antiporter ApNhaP [BD1-7 clade bacterium]
MIEETMGQMLFLGSTVLLGLILSRLSKIDFTLTSLAAGVIAGISLPYLGVDTGLRADNIHEIVFFIVLPVLIFEASWQLDPSRLKRWLAPIMLLSTVGVLISAAVMALLVYYGIGHGVGFPVSAALLTGAILAATDPISVVNTLKRQKAAEDLTTLIEGESLFNDATAVVLFTIVFSLASAHESMSGGYLGLFVTVFFGGILLGCLMGLISAILVLLIGGAAAANIVLLICAFASYYIAEVFFGVSGIMAIVSAAIVSRSLLREQEQKYLASVVNTWDWLGVLFNGFIFVLMGLTITFDMFREQWLSMIIAIIAALIARAATVFVCGAMTKPMLRPIPMGWQKIQFWGGLRGAIAIALVLSLPTSFAGWFTIQSMVFAVVLFTLLVQGPSCGALIRRHGLVAHYG